jgi:ribonuclease HI
MTDEISAIFCDGGVILRNPSEIGGTWAWCAVTQRGDHILEASGYLIPSTAPEGLAHFRMSDAFITNNQTEFYAAMRGLETMSAGWSGILASDSQITLKRVERIMDGWTVPLPANWELRMSNAIGRLGKIRLRHVPGHPTASDLARGYTIKQFRGAGGKMEPRQVRVSRHQVWCDEQCRQLALDARKAGLLVDAASDVAIMGSVEGPIGPRENLDRIIPVGEASR